MAETNFSVPPAARVVMATHHESAPEPQGKGRKILIAAMVTAAAMLIGLAFLSFSGLR